MNPQIYNNKILLVVFSLLAFPLSGCKSRQASQTSSVSLPINQGDRYLYIVSDPSVIEAFIPVSCGILPYKKRVEFQKTANNEKLDFLRTECDKGDVYREFASVSYRDIVNTLEKLHSRRLECLNEGYKIELDRYESLIDFKATVSRERNQEVASLLVEKREIEEKWEKDKLNMEKLCQDFNDKHHAGYDTFEKKKTTATRLFFNIYYKFIETETAKNDYCSEIYSNLEKEKNYKLQAIEKVISSQMDMKRQETNQIELDGDYDKIIARLENDQRNFKKCASAWDYQSHDNQLRSLIFSETTYMIDPGRYSHNQTEKQGENFNPKELFLPRTWYVESEYKTCQSTLSRTASLINLRRKNPQYKDQLENKCRLPQNYMITVNILDNNNESGFESIKWHSFLGFQGVWNDFVDVLCDTIQCDNG